VVENLVFWFATVAVIAIPVLALWLVLGRG
jgi:hypothetical protein